MEIIIRNQLIETILTLGDVDYPLFIEAVKNCIEDPLKYKSITYIDKKDSIIFSAVYLQNSLIIMPKQK